MIFSACEACCLQGLQLGGKDPAYVRADADLDYTVGELVDGTSFLHPLVTITHTTRRRFLQLWTKLLCSRGMV